MKTSNRHNESLNSMVSGVKKARLVEESLSYIDLAVKNNFSEDEITQSLSREMNRDKKDKSALIKL